MKTLTAPKSCGYKKLHTADAFAGLSRRGILKVTQSDIQYRQFNMQSTNKAPPVPVIAENVHDIHQIDLINMRRLKIEYKGILYRYVLSLMDIFSRFHWLVALSTKHAKIFRNELEKITLTMVVLKSFKLILEESFLRR